MHKALLAAFAVALATYAVARVIYALGPRLGSDELWVALMLIGLAGLSGFLAYGLLRLAFRPILAVQKTMANIAKGEYEARIPIDPLDPDFAQLAEHVNHTLDELDRYRRMTVQHLLAEEEQQGQSIARQLHDQAGQSLSAVIMHLDQVLPHLSDDSLVEQTQALRGLLSESLGSVRHLIDDLYPLILEDLGLVRALASYVRRQAARETLDVELEVRGSWNKAPARLELGLYRVAQSVLSAALHRGRAHHIAVAVESSSDGLIMEITHDGENSEAVLGEETVASVTDRVMALHGVLREPLTPHKLSVFVPLPAETAGGGGSDG